MTNLQKKIFDELESWAGVQLTSEEIDNLFNLLDEEDQAAVKLGIDTMEREILMDGLAQMVVGRDWPIYMERDTDFFDRFVEGCVLKGIRLT